MDELKLVIDDYYELLNLHKALLEARFHLEPDNYYVAGSPIISKIHNEILDLLIHYDIERKGSEDWTAWRQLNNQEYYKQRAINGIKRVGSWSKFSYDEKRTQLLNYISPFICTDSEIDTLVREVDGSIVEG